MKKTVLKFNRVKKWCFLLSAALVITNCEQSPQQKPNAIPLVELPAAATGISFENNLVYKDNVNILEYLYYYNGGGVAVGDINNDGLEDLFFTANQGSDKLYLNQGDLKFKDITAEANIYTDDSWSSGVAMEDVNNDGFLDIFVAKVGNHKGLQAHNILYLNNGDGTFTESARALGLDFSGLSTQPAFIDYDRDGDLDLFLLNHAVHTVRSYGTTKKRMEEAPLSGDRFYENRLNEDEGRFVDVTQASGIYSSPLGYGLAVRVADINRDGWPDLYVGNDFHENDFIYLNQKDKSFKEAVKSTINHSSRFTMGVDMADLNNDGLLDIFSTDMMPNRAEIFLKSGGEDTDKVDRIKKDFGFEPQLAHNNLQLQNQDGSFSEVSLMANVYATDWSWSVLLADFDNDLKNDIFISNGIVKRPNDLDYINYISDIKFANYAREEQNELRKEIIAEMPTLKIPNVLFKNQGDLKFSPLEDSFLGAPNFSNGAAFADLDNDGDLDLVVNNINAKASLYENQRNQGGLSIALSHPENKSLNGTSIQLYSQGNTFVQHKSTTRGFQSGSTHKVHFGLPANTPVDSLHIQWPDGKTQRWAAALSSTQLALAYAPDGTVLEDKTEATPFQLSVLPFKYEDNYYLDYEREGLMPEKLSEEGPAFLLEDFNGDGLEDIFVGGARMQPAEIWMAQANGSFEKQNNPDLLSDRNFEDVDAATIDVDLDGDRDLYIVSGGNDMEQNDSYMTDRIYLNDGKGNFKKQSVPLPATNGSTVAVADFDQDGVEDLFVGSRSIPGAYGLSPDSYIMRNNGGKGLEEIATFPFGMVTDSQWVDIDADGLLDLILVGDWMPVTILKNKGEAQFENITHNLGLDNSYGMWNAFAVHDFNGDGRLDIIAGNTGANFKWKPSAEKPVHLYLDDFDENNQLDPIIFYEFFGEYVPFASKDKLAQQMPSIKKKFQQYKRFASVNSIEQLVDKKPEDFLQQKYINELRSMIYLQTENGFEGVPLPARAQQSSIEDLYVDAQGNVSYVGNYFGHVVELGPQDANPGGQLLDFNPKNNTFGKDLNFGLPKTTAARRIERAENGSFVVATQNNFIFFIAPKSTEEWRRLATSLLYWWLWPVRQTPPIKQN